MRTLTKTQALLLVVLVPGLCAGQTTPPETAAPHMVRAAGMPLNDGALAPGMLTVRLVEGAFTRNLADHVVTVEMAGGTNESARTGSDGRAQFAHLPLGARVRAWATVGSERLESEPFEMPYESGVRVLLVTGDGAAPSGQAGPDLAALTSPHPSIESIPSNPPIPTTVALATPGPTDSGVAVIRTVLATSTVFAFGVLFLYRKPSK
jgi:hypothetical protein